MFRDREDAGEALAQALRRWRGSDPLVVAIPRGAVPMAAIVARQLGGALDVVLVRKLVSPYNSELAIGSVDETGWTYIAPHAEEAGANAAYIKRVVGRELATIGDRRKRYTPNRGPLDAEGRLVIVVDDGLATGATMVAALHSLRARRPRRLVCAVPVASTEALALVERYADGVVCLESPPLFHAVGQAYRHFPQVSDDEVIAALETPTSRMPQ